MPIYPGIVSVASQATPPTAAPTYFAEGAGNSQTVATNVLTPGAPPGIVNGNWLFAQVGIRSSLATTTCATPAGWSLPYNDVTTVTGGKMRQFIFSRQYDGSFAMPTFTWGDGGGTSPAARSRIYAVQNTNGAAEGGGVLLAASANANLAIPSVATSGPNRLVLAFFAHLSTTITNGDATGTTGGTYTQPVIAYVGAGAGSIGIQIATLVGTGTIANGNIGLVGGTTVWVCRAFALLPE